MAALSAVEQLWFLVFSLLEPSFSHAFATRAWGRLPASSLCDNLGIFDNSSLLPLLSCLLDNFISGYFCPCCHLWACSSLFVASWLQHQPRGGLKGWDDIPAGVTCTQSAGMSISLWDDRSPPLSARQVYGRKCSSKKDNLTLNYWKHKIPAKPVQYSCPSHHPAQPGGLHRTPLPLSFLMGIIWAAHPAGKALGFLHCHFPSQ